MKLLKRNDRRAEVKELQKLLNGYGFNCGKVDGAFGPKTYAAVKLFQSKRKLKTDGIVGPKTWDALKPTDPILEKFIEWGFIGLMHEKSYKFMVQQFQSAMGLKADGIVGPKTKAALDSEVIVPRFTEKDMSCQCNKYCSGYPQGEISIGVRVLSERIMRETEKTYPSAKFYITSKKTQSPGGATAGGYRCTKWNRLRGGASGSQHKKCIAVDIGCNDATARLRLEKNALSMNKYGGTGYGAKYIVHLDTRGNRARWKY